MKRCIILCNFLFFCVFCLAQLPTQNVNFPSPTASSLGLFGEVPVSLYSGLPNIEIPIYELTEGDIKVPISLKYHASGVRPDVHPGPTGNGWALNAGGMISRVVKGVPDEAKWTQEYTFFNYDYHALNYNVGQIYNNLLQNSGWSILTRIENLAQRGTGYGPNGANGYFQETEPDEFHFNILGLSGKFIFDQDHNIKVLSDPSIKIEPEFILIGYHHANLSLGPATIPYTYLSNNMLGSIGGVAFFTEIKISGFKMTTADGTQYEFGIYDYQETPSNIPYEGSVNFFQQVLCFESWDTWYIRKITSPTKHIVEFEYGIPAGDNRRYPVGSFGLTTAMQKSSGQSNPKGIWKIFGPISANSSEIASYYDGRLIFPTYLTKISTSMETVEFNHSTTTELRYNYQSIYDNLVLQIINGWDPAIDDYFPPYDLLADGPNIEFNLLKWKKLDRIVVSNRENHQRIKCVDLSYSNSVQQRLTLNSISEKGASDLVAPLTYTFTYNTSKTLPGYNSGQTDHWGFYNGKTPTLGSFTDNDFYAYHTYREPDTAFLYAGILEKIQYPTGGYTEFKYEPHEYTSKVVRDVGTGDFSLVATPLSYAGGLRIKQIKNSSGSGQPDIIKTYQYYGGILSGEAQYFWKNYNGQLANGDPYVSDRFVTQTILPVSTNTVGSHIGYSRVRESMAGNGYTDYFYSNYDILDDNFLNTLVPQKSKYLPFSSRAMDRGLLLKKEIYTSDDEIQSRSIYTYQSYDPNNFFRAVNMKQNAVLEGLSIEGTAYKIYNC